MSFFAGAQDKPECSSVQILLHVTSSVVMLIRMLNPFKLITVLLFKHTELLIITLLVCAGVTHYHFRPLSQSLEQIQQNAVLRVLISDDPDAQYVFNQEHYGFEYSLLETFAQSLGVDIELKIAPYGELFDLLKNGNADIVVGGIIDSPFVKSVVQTSIPWYSSRMTVVYKRGEKRPRKIEDIERQPVHTSARYFRLDNLSELNVVDDHRSEYALLNAVNMGEVDYVLSTNYRARNAKHYLPNLNRGFVLDQSVGLIWALPKKHDAALLNVLNQYLATAIDNGLPDVLANHYLTRAKKLDTYEVLSIHKKIETTLPALEYRFKKAARNGKIDWFLLAAMAYQESHWSNDATSPTGVKGVMQLTNSTAEFLNVDDRMDVDQSIAAAARYIKFLKSRLPDRIKEPQRTWFAVGAYNIGLKHVLAAYKKAKRLNINAGQWDAVSELLPSLYGSHYPRGSQAQSYVERVRIFADILRFYDTHQRKTKEMTALATQ